MHLTGLDFIFWAAGFAAHLVLLGVLLIRRRFRVCPIFTALIVTNIVRTITLYIVLLSWNRAGYFYTFWSFGIVDTMIELSVVYEMYSLTFRPLGSWPRDVRSALVCVVTLSVAVAAGLTWLAVPSGRLWVQVVVIKSDFFSAAFMSGLFVGMIFLSVRAGLPWKTHVARIAQGFGAYSMIEVLIETGHICFGLGAKSSTYTALSHFRMSAYLFCVSYWILMLWRNAPEPKRLPEQLHGQLIQLRNMVDANLNGLRARRR
jgi:hypothetical protein